MKTLNTILARWAAVLCLAAASVAHAANVLPLYLEEIVDTSTTAFDGTCTANRTERDPVTNLVVTYTTFTVREALKGTPGTSITIKQIGGVLPDGGMQYRVSGIPTFEVGQDYVVFLAGVSSAGFSSPIGLAQGRFTVRSEGGARKVGNGRDFRDLTARIAQHMPASARTRVQQAEGAVREMDVNDFKQTVRNRMKAGQ
jgi:hypothetical protein